MLLPVCCCACQCRNLLMSAAEPEVRKKREYKDMEHGEKEQNLHAKVDMNTVSKQTNCTVP